MKRDSIPNQITEKQFRQQVLELAKVLGYASYFTWTSIHSPAGMPDLILCKPPRVLFAELKTEKGKLTDKQRMWVDLLSQCPGVECYVWRPSDFNDIAKLLQDTAKETD